jgi:sugar lactone lactonase YvrE
MNRLSNQFRRACGVLSFRPLAALACLIAAVACSAAAIPWTDNQAIEHTIGNGSGTASAQSVGVADAVAIDAVHGKLYVTDRQNHRVLRFAYPATSDQPTAEAVFGQADFTSGSINRGNTSPAANTMNVPYGLAVAANGDLWVADHGNNRLLKFATAYSAVNGVDAVRVLGQSSFTESTGACTNNRLQSPSGLFIDTFDNLWVADTSNNRVVRFAAISSAANGAAAVQVLGQSAFTSNTFTPGTTTANRLYGPYAVCVAGTTLWVADSQNNRVVRYNNATAKALDAAADGVLGQADLTSGAANRGGSAAANTLSFPGGITVDDSGTLIVSDSFNYRVLIFANAASLANGSAATNQLANINIAWNLAYDSTYHRLLVARAGGFAVNQYFNAHATTTTLASSANPASLASTVTFTATVSTTGGGATASGTVRFTDGSATLGTATLNSSGVATFSTSGLSEGDHTIIAEYLEGYAHKASTSTALTQVVGRYTPTITLATASNPSSASDALVVTASVQPPATTPTMPTGTVEFRVDGTTRATVTLNASGIASWTTSDLAVGTYTLSAVYSGNANFRSVSATATQVVNPVGLREFSAIANVERDDNGTTVDVYSGAYWGGMIYIGLYDGYTCWAAYRFDLTTATFPIQKAELKVRVALKSSTAATTPIELHGSSDDAWSDATTPPTAPGSVTSPALATVGSDTFVDNDWLTFDVTSFVTTQLTGDKVATFVFTAPTAAAQWFVGFYSREAGTSAPVLQITEALTYAKWASGNFTASELADSSISGATADPDGIGITNLMRFALGLPARGATTLPVGTTFSGGTATVTFPIPAARSGVQYVVQSSQNLTNWTDVQTYTSSATAQSVSRDITAPTGSTRFFVRLKITAP